MNIDSIPKVKELSESLERLKYQRHCISESYRLSFVYLSSTRKCQIPKKEDQYISINSLAVSHPYQENILNDLKKRCLEHIDKEIQEICKQISEL